MIENLTAIEMTARKVREFMVQATIMNERSNAKVLTVPGQQTPTPAQFKQAALQMQAQANIELSNLLDYCRGLMMALEGGAPPSAAQAVAEAAGQAESRPDADAPPSGANGHLRLVGVNDDWKKKE